MIGAILHLALTLGVQVLVPSGAPDWFALLLAVGGLLALVRGWLGIVPLLGLSAALGVAWPWVSALF